MDKIYESYLITALKERDLGPVTLFLNFGTPLFFQFNKIGFSKSGMSINYTVSQKTSHLYNLL